MKKYLWTMVVMAMFAIGFAASDEDESSNSESPSSEPQVEQRQETEEERQAREQKEEKNKKEEKIKKVLEEARIMGDICPVSMYSYAKDDCKTSFINTFGTPSSNEDFEMYKIYEEEYMRVWSEKQDAKKKMDNF